MAKRRIFPKLVFLLALVLAAGGMGFYQLQAKVNEPAGLLVRALPSSDKLLITGVQVFDSDQQTLRPARAVEIRNGKVAAIHWNGALPAFDSGETLAGRGRILVPGLTDFHAHFGSSDGRPPWAMDGLHMVSVAAQREAYLYSGVTAVVEGSPNALNNFDRQAGLSPAVFTSTRMITADHGHPVPMFEEFVPWPLTESVIEEQVLAIRSTGENAQDIDALVKGPGHHVKVVFDAAIPWDSPRITEQDLRGIVVAAHAAGKPVYIHVGSAMEAVTAARAGADVLMHTPYADLLSEDDLAALKQTGVQVVTTAQIWEWYTRGLSGQPSLTRLERQLASPSLLAAWEEDWGSRLAEYHSTTFSADYRARIAGFASNQAENIRRLYRAGVPQLVGTDFGIPGLTPGASLIRELELLQSYGLAAPDLLRMATSQSGRLLGRAGSAMGRIQPGSPADLLLLSGNPTEDIGALADLDYVIQRGVVYRRNR